jgi:hypothetical protein
MEDSRVNQIVSNYKQPISCNQCLVVTELRIPPSWDVWTEQKTEGWQEDRAKKTRAQSPRTEKPREPRNTSSLKASKRRLETNNNKIQMIQTKMCGQNLGSRGRSGNRKGRNTRWRLHRTKGGDAAGRSRKGGDEDQGVSNLGTMRSLKFDVDVDGK